MKTKKLFKKILFFTLTLSLFAIPLATTVFAATAPNSYVPLAPLPGTCAGGGDCANKPVDLGSYIQGMFKLLIGVAAALAVIMIVIGGITYMSSDAISGKSEGKDIITQAIYGLLLAMASWLILYTVNPQLLQFTALNDIPDVPASQTTPVYTHYGKFFWSIPDGPSGIYCTSGYSTNNECVAGLSAAKDAWLAEHPGGSAGSSMCTNNACDSQTFP